MFYDYGNVVAYVRKIKNFFFLKTLFIKLFKKKKVFITM